MIGDIRRACLASWVAAERTAKRDDGLLLNSSSGAGMILVWKGGNVDAAVREAQHRGKIAPWWNGVTWVLAQINLEEGRPRAARG